MKKTNDEWKKILDHEVYRITRENGTEMPFSGKLLNNNETGMYQCSNCHVDLFSSETKYDSSCGWPTFYKPVDDSNIEYGEDQRFGMIRTSIICKNCKAHLGHVFPDGPRDKGGQRFCVNSLSLNFKKNG